MSDEERAGRRAAAYSERIDAALRFAAAAHGDQVRKGTNVPYVMHPFHVGLLLDRHGYAEDVVVAGILLGREWEPGSVFKTNQENRQIRQYRGDFICMNDGNAMEAWLAGTPVIANGGSDVVRWHCERSGAGLVYDDEAEFAECLRLVAEAPDVARRLAKGGLDYVPENYTWERVLDGV